MSHTAIQAESLPARVNPARPARTAVEARYTHRLGDHELVLVAPKVDGAMTEAVARGEAEFGLILEESFLGLCCRFGEAIPWACAFYGWDATPREERILPPGLDQIAGRVPLYVSLVDGRGAARAERCITLSMDFSRALLGALREQARMPVDPGARRQEMARLRRRCPTPDALAASATVRCRGQL